MSTTTDSHLDRLARAEDRLFRKLSNIKKRKAQHRAEVEHDGIVWVPPGWGMDYWEKGLRYRPPDSGEAIKFRQLSPEDLHDMVGKFDGFAAYIKEQFGVDLEPPANPGGGGLGHAVKYVCSPAYRRELAERAKLAKITAGLEKLDKAKEDAERTLSDLEEQEAKLLEQGKRATSDEVRKRLVPRIKQVRKDAQRAAAIVNFVNAKMESGKTALHNTKLDELGRIAGLPDEDELAESQASAEETRESVERALAVADEVVDFDLSSDADAAIMAELAGTSPTTEAEKEAAEQKEDAAIMAEFGDDDEEEDDDGEMEKAQSE